ncbi:MAG TPA: glycoside hydrolase family 6 protein [Solirubrobacteraceae bacterium]|nr:glycoside hydrolase family 6 protein [Solirubrobacteraceae bacterium]
MRMPVAWRRRAGALAGVAVCLLPAPAALATPRSRATDPLRAADSGGAGTTELSQSAYSIDEDAGSYPITIVRSTDLSKPEVIYYGVTIKGAQAGHSFQPIANTRAVIPAGERSLSFRVTVDDQGISGPTRYATAYIFGPSLGTLGDPSRATLDLLQHDPLQHRDRQNPLGYARTPTDGDPLQFVRWYVFGESVAPGQLAVRYAGSNPARARALHRLAYSPGSWSYRFWMWNQPAAALARNVELYLADAEHRQPDTTVPLSTYSLIHGNCEDPRSIRRTFRRWIRQLARGIGNFRVVLYLEIDSVLETHCIDAGQLQVRLRDELAYAVHVLARDPHVLVYVDAGAPGVYNSVPRTARYLREADIGEAAGFFVNATHYNWLTDDIHWGQQIAQRLGGAHFIVQSDDDGRGPYVPAGELHRRNGDTCNPPGRGAGPLSWNTGYRYLDGLLWFNDPGNSDGPCGAGDPAVGVFWPAYAVGLIQREVDRVTGPRLHLLRSNTDM